MHEHEGACECPTTTWALMINNPSNSNESPEYSYKLEREREGGKEREE